MKPSFPPLPLSLPLTLIPLLLLLIPIAKSTIVTFYVDYQIQQPLDYVEISAIIKTNSQSLQRSINDAQKIIKDIESTVNIYCHSYAKDKSQCLEIITASPFSIKTQYQIQKKKPIFTGFVVAHQILIKVKESPAFGKLIDDILKKGVDRINSLSWKPLQEIYGEEIAVGNGIAQANQICKKIGMKLTKIIHVQEVTDFGEEQQQKQPNSPESPESQQDKQPQSPPLDINDNIVYYKFIIQCNKK